MGTPDLAAAVLRRLVRWPGGDVVAVYTQPDRPAGRGHKLTPSPVKKLALELGLPVHQPLNFRQEGAVDELAALKPDLLVVAAYGLILPQAVLDIPTVDTLNVHTSLLPRYRGAAPIQRAVMENWQPGDVTGVSIMRIVPALDAGPVYASARCPSASIRRAACMTSWPKPGASCWSRCWTSSATAAPSPVNRTRAASPMPPS